MKNLQLLLLIALTGCLSCKASYNIHRPYGDLVEIKYKDGVIQRGELILLEEEALVYRQEDRFYHSSLGSIRKIKIAEEYIFKGAVPLKIGVATLLGAGSVLSFIGDVGGIGLGIGMVAATGGIIASIPIQASNYRFQPPLSVKKRNRLLLHCRYPQGLTPEQRQRLIPSEIEY